MLSSRNGLLIKAAVVLAVLWGLVWVGLSVSRSKLPTPEKLAAYVEAHPLGEIEDPEQRRQVIGEVAEMLNQLDPGDVRRLIEENQEDPRRAFFEEMSPDEQKFFMEKRVGRAFDQMMVAFNDMDREERKRIIERTLKQMRQEGGERRDGLQRLEETDPAMAEKIVNEGLRAYYQQANSETKLDLAPVLEEMQRNLTGGPRRR
jgi:pyruvate-formate lyase